MNATINTKYARIAAAINNAAIPDHISISSGNVKMGDIQSISILPGVTCRDNAPCRKNCYACRMCRYPNVKKAYTGNTALYMADPDRYFSELSRALMVNRFFRVHVAGDVIDGEYFDRLVKAVAANPHCEALMFTKEYEIVNGFIADGGTIPANFHIIFSNWENWKCENPYNFPVTDVIPAGAACPADGKLCGGNCFECAAVNGGCWNLQRGEKLYFHMH